MNYKAILFDMDGVLIDSEFLMRKSATLALADYGITACEEDFLPFTGQGEDRFVGGVAAKYGVEYKKEMKERAYYYYGKYIFEDTEVPEGLLDVLTKLKEAGIKMIVCTSADKAKVIHNLRAMNTPDDMFDEMITGDVIINKKPDPEIYLKGAALTGFDFSDIIVVEDSPSGVKAAHAGGMKAIAIASSFSVEELKAACDPDIIINDLHELLDIVL